MRDNNLVKNISLTFIANIVALLVSILSTLVIPKLIGLTSYGYWQLYLFYISYAGILHLGLCDGVYLTNGGKYYNQLDKRSLRNQYYLLLTYLLVFCILISIVSAWISKDFETIKVIRFTCVGAFFHVLKTYILLVLQATNEMKKYSLITIYDRVIFIISILFFMCIHSVTYESIIICDIAGRVISLFLATYYTKDIIYGKVSTYRKFICDFKENITCGFQLLLSGIASNFIIGFVRIGIKSKWDIDEFGKISLSLSVINMVLSFINMAAIVFFPVLKRLDDEKKKKLYQKVEYLIIVMAFSILIFSGIGKNIIGTWLPQYDESMIYMVLLLPICIFESETAMLSNTYLKALRKEKALLIVNIIMTITSAIFAYVSTQIWGNIMIALVGIDILVMCRGFLLKRVIYTELELKGYFRIVCEELILLCIYLLAYIKFNIIEASILYLIAFSIYIMVNMKKIKKYIIYFKSQKERII